MKIGFSQTEIAQQIGVHRSIISYEIRRNTGKRGYRYKLAQRIAQRQCKKTKKRIQSSDWALFDRHMRKEFSHEQTSHWVPDYYHFQVSHEWIYKHIWEDERNGGELYKHLLCKKKYRIRDQKDDIRGKQSKEH